MSTTNQELSSVACKGESETNIDHGKRRFLKQPTPISARQKINSKTTIGTRSLSKTDILEIGNATNRSTSRNRMRSSSIGNNGQSRMAKASGASTSSSNAQKRIIENQYLTKKNRYNVVRREMENKHKVAVEMYDEVLQLREKVIASGGKDPGKPDEIGLSPCTEKEKLFDSHNIPEIEPQIQIPECDVDNEFMENIESNFQSLSEGYIEFCKEILSDRMRMVSWFIEFDREECDNDATLNQQIEIFHNEDKNFAEKLEQTNLQQLEIISNIVQKFQSLWTEVESYRTNCKNIKNIEHNLMEVEKLKNSLDFEMEKSSKLKASKGQLDVQLVKLKSKIREFETQVSNGEGKISHLQNSLEQLKSQVKQKEALLEQQTKDMQKVSRGHKNVITKMESQKEVLESRIASLTDELANKNLAAETVQKTMNQLEERVRELDREKQLRLQVEAKLAELKEHKSNLEKENKLLTMKAESLASEGSNETRLCNELEDAKTTILKQEERIDQLHREREDLIVAMKRASGQEATDEKQSKLMADLLKTTNELKNFKEENLQLKKNLKAAVGKGETVQKQLSELHSRLQNQCKENGKADFSALIIDLQQQNSDLKCTLTDFIRQNKKLEAELSQKQVELECVQQNQGKLLKLREEMKNHKNPNQNVEKKDGRELKQKISPKSMELQEIFTALEGKQMRIKQLEQMLEQMEEQQNRAQAQRTRLESRIAQLEMSAKEKTHRNKTFNIL